MKKLILTIAFLAAITTLCLSQNVTGDELLYRRNSVYSILISHTEQEDYAQLIRGQFANIPIPEKFYDHNLSVNVVNVNSKNAVNDTIVQDFINKNRIASRMVANGSTATH